jgi:hypothetical protein
MTWKLSKFADQIAISTAPRWVKDAIVNEKQQIIGALQRNEEYLILSPDGLQTLSIKKTMSWWSRFKNLFRK